MDITVDMERHAINSRAAANMTALERDWIKISLLEKLLEMAQIIHSLNLPAATKEFILKDVGRWSLERDRLISGIPRQ